MKVEKQTYLNTEHLNELYEKKGTASSSYPSGRTYGGVRFRLRRKASVFLSAEVENPTGTVTLFLDGLILLKSASPHIRFELKIDKGAHLFDLRSDAANDGFCLTANGVGLEADRAYTERVGGYSTDSANYLFLRHGNRLTEKVTASSGSISSESQSGIMKDAALRFNKSTGFYTSDLATISASGTTSLAVDTGTSATLSTTGLTSAAICDGYTLPSGVDFLVAFVADNKLYVGKASAGQGITSSDFATPISDIVRVVSAQRGSVLMTENAEGLWKAMYFFSSGSKSLTCGGTAIPYEEISLVRNRAFAPTCHIEGALLSPAFYYRTEEGALMRLMYGSTPVKRGYAEAFHPGDVSSMVQYCGEVRLASL